MSTFWQMTRSSHWQLMRLGLFVLALALVLVCSHAQSCQAPGTCSSPNAEYSRVMPAAPRLQWWTSGGYCGALSVQSIALGFGVWVSQDLVRKAAPPGGGHGDPADGYEILHTNIEAALENLRLVNTAFPWQTAPLPQSNAYLLWLKQQLRAGSPVVWFIMCRYSHSVLSSVAIFLGSLNLTRLSKSQLHTLVAQYTAATSIIRTILPNMTTWSPFGVSFPTRVSTWTRYSLTMSLFTAQTGIKTVIIGDSPRWWTRPRMETCLQATAQSPYHGAVGRTRYMCVPSNVLCRGVLVS
jgi:hypothetical protein